MILPEALPDGLRDLFDRLRTYAVNWNPSHGGQYDPLDDRVERPLEEANVVSSILKPQTGDDIFSDWPEDRHILAIDVDYPAYSVPSSTEGHCHVYFAVPGGLKQSALMEILEVLGKHGVIEEGYAKVSQMRGRTDLRLPWIEKSEGDRAPSVPPSPSCCVCRKRPSEIDEYRDAITAEGMIHESDEPVTDADIDQWVRQNEGTYNPANGLFACTDCYIRMGQPSGPNGWKPGGVVVLQPIPVQANHGLPTENLRFF